MGARLSKGFEAAVTEDEMAPILSCDQLFNRDHFSLPTYSRALQVRAWRVASVANARERCPVQLRSWTQRPVPLARLGRVVPTASSVSDVYTRRPEQ